MGAVRAGGAVAMAMIEAEPTPVSAELDRIALGNDVSRLKIAVAPCRAVLAAARAAGMFVIRIRESHRPDLTIAP